MTAFNAETARHYQTLFAGRYAGVRGVEVDNGLVTVDVDNESSARSIYFDLAAVKHSFRAVNMIPNRRDGGFLVNAVA